MFLMRFPKTPQMTPQSIGRVATRDLRPPLTETEAINPADVLRADLGRSMGKRTKPKMKNLTMVFLFGTRMECR